MDVCLLRVLCVAKYESLHRAHHSSRGVLPSVVCLSVIVKLDNEQALADWGMLRHGKKIHGNELIDVYSYYLPTYLPTIYHLSTYLPTYHLSFIYLPTYHLPFTYLPTVYHLSTYLPTYLPIIYHLPTYLPIIYHLSTYLHTYPSSIIYLPTYLSSIIYLPTYLPTCHLSFTTYLPIIYHLSTYLSSIIYLPTYLSSFIYLSTYLPIPIPIHPSVTEVTLQGLNERRVYIVHRLEGKTGDRLCSKDI